MRQNPIELFLKIIEKKSKTIQRTRNPVELIIREIAIEAVKLGDPLLVSPSVASRIRAITALLMILSISSSLGSVMLAPFSLILATFFSLLSILLLITAQLLPHAWRSILASGIEQEVPALLLYILPYSSSPKFLVDVLANIPKEVFKWTTHESEKLKLIMSMGHDPLTSLSLLAKATPSKSLRRILREYTNLQRIGATSKAASLRLTERAVDAIKDKWRGYTEAGRLVVEALASGFVAIAALSPLASSSKIGLLTLLPILAGFISALLLLMARPSIGDLPSPAWPVLIPLLSSLLSSLLVLHGSLLAGAIILIGATIPIEALAVKARRREVRALESLSLAAEHAKFGRDYHPLLAEAEEYGGGVIKAIAKASRVAGSIGVGEALDKLVDVLWEAISVRRRTWMEAVILEILSSIAPVIGAVAMIKLGSFLSQTPSPFLPNATPLNPKIALAAAPIAPLPASVLRRGKLASLVSGLLTLLALYILVVNPIGGL